MYVCLCHKITEKEILSVIKKGFSTCDNKNPKLKGKKYITDSIMDDEYGDLLYKYNFFLSNEDDW